MDSIKRDRKLENDIIKATIILSDYILEEKIFKTNSIIIDGYIYKLEKNRFNYTLKKIYEADNTNLIDIKFYTLSDLSHMISIQVNETPFLFCKKTGNTNTVGLVRGVNGDMYDDNIQKVLTFIRESVNIFYKKGGLNVVE